MTEQVDIKGLLISSGLVSHEDYTSAEKIASHLNYPIVEVLIGRRVLDERALGELLARQYGVPYVDLKKIEIPSSLVELIPQEMAMERRAIPFERDGNNLHVALEDPKNLETIEFIRKTTGLTVIPYLAIGSSIKYALRFYKKNISDEFNNILNQRVALSTPGAVAVEKLAQDVSIIHVIDTVLEYAVSEDASDIHIETFGQNSLIRYRIDGMLHDVVTLPKTLHSGMVARIKILSDLKIDETRLPQDGRFRYKTRSGETVSLRVSILPTVEGEKIVLRILESVLQRFSLEDIGLNEEDTKIIRGNISKPHGLILVTGPTGSGKTTTLYTILGLLNTTEVNISTVEDPVENRVPRVNQTQTNSIIGFGFAEGLRALLRQDPNIIMVGEIRDQETSSISINAAMTGHLVLSTLHTNDAPGAIPRLIDLGVEPFLLASTLRLIMAQRLVRLICKECKKISPISQQLKESIYQLLASDGYSEQSIGDQMPNEIARGDGCVRCTYTGYRGRTAIYELVVANDDIKNLIIKRATAGDIRKHALLSGMRTMLFDGLVKVRLQQTTPDEILRVTSE